MGMKRDNPQRVIDKSQSESVEYLKAMDEAKDNTRIARYVFLLIVGFMAVLFATYFLKVGGDESEPLLSSELIHFIAGALFTSFTVIVDRYFKNGSQKETEKNLAYLTKKLMNEEVPDEEQQGEKQ